MHIDDDSLDANVITDVFQKGYKYNDKVVRPAMVKTANLIIQTQEEKDYVKDYRY